MWHFHQNKPRIKNFFGRKMEIFSKLLLFSEKCGSIITVLVEDNTNAFRGKD